MYKLSIYENKLSFKYRIEQYTFRWKWVAELVAVIAIFGGSHRYRDTGVYLTTEIEKV